MENIVYFDNAATTFPKPECVYTAMDQFARTCGVSIGRWQHSLSSKAAYIADETRELLQELFHASNKKVVFTNTATEALNIIIRGINIPKGANVYISPFEHNAVTRTLHYLQKQNDFQIIQLACSKDMCKRFHPMTKFHPTDRWLQQEFQRSSHAVWNQ